MQNMAACAHVASIPPLPCASIASSSAHAGTGVLSTVVLLLLVVVVEVAAVVVVSAIVVVADAQAPHVCGHTCCNDGP